MIIIEGPDSVGKTTLAKKLEAHGDVFPAHAYRHFSRLRADRDPVWFYERHCDVDDVIDRFHMSEIVYAVCRGEAPVMTPLGYQLIDAMIRLRCGFIVVVTCDTHVLHKKMKKDRRDQMYDSDFNHEVNETFINLANDRRISQLADYMPVSIDYHIHLSEVVPWPSDAHIQEIVRLYAHRRAAWRLLMQESRCARPSIAL